MIYGESLTSSVIIDVPDMKDETTTTGYTLPTRR